MMRNIVLFLFLAKTLVSVNGDITECYVNGTEVLRDNVCVINDECYEAGENIVDDNCKVCNPDRRRDGGVYKTRTLKSNVLECKDRYVLDCHELYVKATWEKDMFAADTIEMTLNDDSCNDYQANMTHIWVTTYFDDCGSTHTSTPDIITQENTASLKITYNWLNVIERTVVYKYRMECIFDRRVNVSTANYYEVTLDLEGLQANQSDRIEFNASMAIYTSDSFLTIAPSPLSVTSFQPIYVRIEEGYENELFRFVVNQCYATPEASGESGTQYTFLDRKCPLDPSFEQLDQTIDRFDYKIDAFTFIEVRRSVYLHCKLFICPINDTSQECTQECITPARRRRSLEEEERHRSRRDTDVGPVETIDIRSEEIEFKRVKTCKDISCPENSRCIDLYPAECRCNEGYVMYADQNRCVNDNMFEAKGLKIEGEFLKSYSNTTSTDFLKFSSSVEAELMVAFKMENDKIIGVKVIGARQGSIILDLQFIFAKDVSVEEAKDMFIKGVTIARKQTLSSILESILSNVNSDVTPDISKRAKEVPEEKDNTVLIAVATAAVLVVAIAILSVVIVKFCTRPKVVKANIDGFVNAGVDNEKVSVEMGNY